MSFGKALIALALFAHQACQLARLSTWGDLC
jgi:hypothetical protein